MSAQPIEEPGQPCTRRWFATWSDCPCPNCVTERIKHRKRHEAGLIRRVPSDDAWTVLEQMIEQKWTGAAIASACNISILGARSLLEAHRDGAQRVIGAVIAHRIVNHGKPTAGYVSTLGSTRRLRALAAIGWTGDTLAGLTDGAVSRMTLSYVTNGTRPTLRPQVADAIDALYRRLADTPGPSGKARARARKNGWGPPASWDNIDDPRERPKGVLRTA